MPSKYLTPEQKADAARLKQAYLDKKAETGLTQATLADACGWETQSAVSQYLNGKIPLNIDALTLMCEQLGVEPAAISPSIVKQARSRAIGATGKFLEGSARSSAPLIAEEATAPPVHSLKAKKGGLRTSLIPADLWERLESLDSTQLKSAISVLRAHLDAVAPARSKRRRV